MVFISRSIGQQCVLSYVSPSTGQDKPFNFIVDKYSYTCMFLYNLTFALYQKNKTNKKADGEILCWAAGWAEVIW